MRDCPGLLQEALIITPRKIGYTSRLMQILRENKNILLVADEDTRRYLLSKHKGIDRAQVVSASGRREELRSRVGPVYFDNSFVSLLARDYQQRLREMSQLVKEVKHKTWQNWHELSIKLEKLER